MSCTKYHLETSHKEGVTKEEMIAYGICLVGGTTRFLIYEEPMNFGVRIAKCQINFSTEVKSFNCYSFIYAD
jgi:hypothetical protein